ncbi:MAG: glycine cleavage system protein R [Synoicihabitans sp.]
MRTTLVMTIIGPDRTGLVDALARPVAEHGGNWLESSMCRLGGRFAGLVRVEVEDTDADALRASIAAIDIEGLQITVQADSADAVVPNASLVAVELVGQDRPGLLREITGVFARHALNVEELSSECSEAPLGGGKLFKANATLSLPASADLDRVGDDLEKIATDLMVDIRVAPEG